MSKTTTPEPAPDPQAGEHADQQEQPQEPTEAKGRPNEAAKYRRQLRDTERERDTLRERVTALQRAEVERMAGDTLAKPAGLWTSGVELEALLDESGNIDPEKVTEAVEAAVETVGLAKRVRHPIVPNIGDTPADKRHYGSSFRDAFAPNPY